MIRWWIFTIVFLGLFLTELSFSQELSIFSVTIPLLVSFLFAVLLCHERKIFGLLLIVGLGGELLSTSLPGSFFLALLAAAWLLRYLEKTVLASTTWESRLALLSIGGVIFSVSSQLFWLLGWFLGILETFPASVGRATLGVGIETVSIAIFGLSFLWVLGFGNLKLFRASDFGFRIFRRL